MLRRGDHVYDYDASPPTEQCTQGLLKVYTDGSVAVGKDGDLRFGGVGLSFHALSSLPLLVPAT
eukprot:3607995-Alexandrium_andersonii.AAC.1